MSMLRGQRATFGVEEQKRRVGTSEVRQAHATERSLKDYQKDLGIATDAGTAKALRAQEAQWQEGVSERKGLIGTASKEYQTAQSELSIANEELTKAAQALPSGKAALDKGWQSYRKGLTPVRVVDKSGHNVEATYYIPKEAAEKISKQEGLVSSWHGPYMNVSVMVQSGKGLVGEGQMIHDTFRDAGIQTEAAYRSKAAPAIAKQLAKSYKELESYRADLASKQAKVDSFGREVSTARGLLRGDVAEWEKQWADLRGRYAKRAKAMEAIFGGMKVG